MRPRVLVTRPEPGAGRTARRLAGLGYEAVVLPLTEIRALDADPGSIDADALAATSANSVRLLRGPWPERLLSLPFFAVGDATAEAARAAGFRQVVAGQGDGAALARQVTERSPAGTRLAYLCGRVRRPEFERALEKAGMKVQAVETYDTAAVPLAPEAFRAALGGGVSAALAYSPEGAAALAAIIARSGTATIFETAHFLCLSQAVATALGGTRTASIRVGRAPSEDALMALLEEVAPPPR